MRVKLRKTGRIISRETLWDMKWLNEKLMERTIFKGHSFEEDKLTRGKCAQKQHWVWQWRSETKLCCIECLPLSFPLFICLSVRKGFGCCQCCATCNLKINLTSELNKAALTITGTWPVASSISCVRMCVFVNWAGQKVEKCCCGACLVYPCIMCLCQNTARQG